MKRFMRRQGGDVGQAELHDGVEAVSPDLPYELQSKLFDQLATVSVAGAGLAVTLIGSVLRDAPPDAWLSVVLFAMAATTAVSGNQKLIDGLSRRRPGLRRSRRTVQIAFALLGVATGWLSMSLYAHAQRSHPAEASAPSAP